MHTGFDLREAEFDAAGSERVNDLGDIVANDAEASRRRMRFDDATKGSLRVYRHRVGLVKNTDLDGWTIRVRTALDFSLRKFLNLFADNFYAALV